MIDEQNQLSTGRVSPIIIVILLSLLLHLFLMFFFLGYQHYTDYERVIKKEAQVIFDSSLSQPLPQQLPDQTQPEQPKSEPEQPQTQWAGGNANSAPRNPTQDYEHLAQHAQDQSTQDAPDLQDNNDITQEQDDTDSPQSLQENQKELQNSEKLQKALEEKNITQKDIRQNEEKLLKQELKPMPDTKPDQKQLTKLISEIDNSANLDKKQLKNEDQDKSSTDQNLTEHIKELTAQKALAQAKKTKQKKLTLADIGHGFVNKVNQQSEHYVGIISEHVGKPSLEQLKYEQYYAKIFRCVHTSEKIYRHRMHLTKHVDTSADIVLTLNRDGRIVSLKMIRSCGYPEIDEYFLFIYQDASKSFPPVPAHLKDDPLVMNIRQFITTQAY